MTDIREDREAADLTLAVARLAALDPLDYDRVRKSEADRLGVRVATLDDAVKRARPKTDEPASASGGRALSLPDTEPWPDPVNGAIVLDDVSAAFTRHLALPPGAADALALWCAYTHAFDAFPISPRLAITSPEKRCGKTTLLRMLAMVCERVLQAANITPAAMFRAIELARPTLLVDEADTFLEGREELRGVLNSGHARDGRVIRTVGDDHEPRQFSTWAPCAIAMIGRLPDTLADRSIAVPMRRRTPGEQIERLRFDQPNLFDGVRRRLARFTMDVRPALEHADPAIPAHLHDRAADNWRVLFAIADAAGGAWPTRARAACMALNAGETDADTMGATLLSDIQAAFVLKGDPVKLSSADLCQTLADDEASPWAAFGRSEKPITAAALARLLKRFKIAPKVMRNGANVWRGYERDAFADAWSRYLNPDTPPQSVTPLHAVKDKAFNGNATRNMDDGVTPRNPSEVLTGQGMLRCNGSIALAPDEKQRSRRYGGGDAMSVAAILARAEGFGVQVHAVGNDLKARWSANAPPPPDLIAALKANKLAILAAMSVPPDAGEWRDYFEERAAILEHDGGMSRADAEAGALADCVARWRALNPLPASGDGVCVQCGKARPDTPVLARGGHAWLHRQCWAPMNAARNEMAFAAVRALLGHAP